ncbi:hypothetical protein DEO72_LG10g1247 [Vigna unguiculata]|uniref:Uncharacterized protein n=1 Tax=Vigna unguiculata TaxID=3917 RepID=A0A4D6N855_VIGUN|nr:hypothetical protein DEO72_LG10g1247 [Vigna unguiculata]
MFRNINTSKTLNLQKAHIIPLSGLKRLLAHLSNHLLPDNESFDHRHAHTDRADTDWKPPGGHIPTARRYGPDKTRNFPSPPGGDHPAARRLALTVTTATGFHSTARRYTPHRQALYQ